VNEYEGTVDENDQGPWVWSGDEQGARHGYTITMQGGTYLQSPFTDDMQTAADAIIASRQGQVAWLAYYSTAWPDMHTWLQARSVAHRTRLYQLCRGFDGIAALL